ncbi:GNAT family N-acetyltransferase [Tropicimonas sp. S265A]|uniref:GNAT family N-acetyltransferase n=1 Tax=Tropicimonas sp. S265A TaxID=3415134 RepID=UPI003C7A1E95
MLQPDGFTDVPYGKVATVVTHLHMLEPPDLRASPDLPALVLDHVRTPDPDWYRTLYMAVGGKPWLWFSQMTKTTEALVALLHDPAVEVFVLRDAGREIGLLELDFRDPGACEIAFFGLVPEAVGQGAGRYMMNIALTRAWQRDGVRRVWVHTCTLDHPDAVAFYIRSGFTPLRQQIEVADDPRLTGVLPRDAAPHIPIFEG